MPEHPRNYGDYRTLTLNPPVKAVVKEIASRHESPVLRHELIYDGFVDGFVKFTENSFANNIEAPDKISPLVIKSAPTPFTINVKGLIVDVLEVTPDSIRYAVKKGWD